jgi:guanylate kinase
VTHDAAKPACITGNPAGSLIVISGPSGAGKGTIVKALLDQYPSIHYSVSATTRAPREGEVNGINYWFVAREEFERMREQNELLEWAEVYGNFYGTPRLRVMEAIGLGHDIILEIDPQGAMKIKERFPSAVFVYIMPPSPRELSKRIRGRGTESQDAIRCRLNSVANELRYVHEYDYLVINDNLDEATTDVASIIRAEKWRVKRNVHMIGLVWGVDFKQQEEGE